MPASCRCIRVGLLAALVAAGPVALVAEDRAGESLYRLDVLLTAAPTLSDSARAAMMNEAAAI